MPQVKNFLLLTVLLFATAFKVRIPAPSAPQDLAFEVLRVYPTLAPTHAQLVEARTLKDLNPHFKSEWVRTYLSTSVSTLHRGKTRIDYGNSALLTPEQKSAILSADTGSEVRVLVQYIPENNLKHNEPKEMSFTLIQDPGFEATFPGGKRKLRHYLKKNAIDKIPDGTFEDYDLCAIGFTINEEGQVVDVQVRWPFKDKSTEELLVGVLCNMPNWEPGHYANGTKVKQEFVLTVGNMKNCMLNTINIK